MGLEDKIAQDLLDAMRARQEVRVRALRMVKAAFSNLRFVRTDPKNPQYNEPVTEGDLLRVVENQIKQRRESIELYERGKRPELAAAELAEIQELEPYLPRQMTRDEIKAEVEAIAAQLGTRAFPKVMKEAATRLRGRADGKLVNEVVKEVTGT